MQKKISIVWFRQDLRLSDNPTITAASELGDILPVYIFDDCAPNEFKLGNASKIWLHHALENLNASLNRKLNFYIGPSDKIITLLITRYNVTNLFWNICYEPWSLDQERTTKEICAQTSTKFEVFNSNYLYSPNQILKEDQSYYKVFTAYKNKSHTIPFRTTVCTPKHIRCIQDLRNTTTLEDLNLLQHHTNIKNFLEIGESAAQKKLTFFIKNHLFGYKEDRNYPSKEGVSKLSAHLHFGEISPSQILESIHRKGCLYAKEHDIEHFLNEILWREFSCYLLYHFKELPKKNFNAKFNTFPWKNNSNFLQNWKKGTTGYPFIDAGMRELWQTGYMHNRVRMVVASFLVKNLNIHWQQGMNWFWERLLDADLSNNSASWQWIAGSGADATPYFRIFNPITQGEKFDSNGAYTKRFVPELKNIPNAYLFKPWTAPEHILSSAGVILGETYPTPIIEFSISRKNALHQYALL